MTERTPERPRPDDEVRRHLRGTEEWLRTTALLALDAWDSVGHSASDLFQALTALSRPAFGTWNGLLAALRRVRRDALRAASADLRARIEAATPLSLALDAVARRLAPKEVESLAALATLVRRERPRTLGDAVEAAITLRNRVVHDPPMSADDPWWTEAATALEPLGPLLPAPVGVRSAPWFLSGSALAFNGLEDDFHARYVGPSGAREVSAQGGADVLRAFARLLGREAAQEEGLRRTLGRLAPEEQCGVLLGDLLLVAEVGSGGWATVYRGMQITTGRRVAVKVLHDGATEAGRARFRQEAELLSRVSHPHVVAVLGQGEDPWRLPRSHAVRATWVDAWARGAAVRSYIVLEWIEGPTLEACFQVWHGRRDGASGAEATAVARQRPDDRTLLLWLRDAARSVEAVHTAGLLHRDVKPGNVMVDADGRIKLLDLGIARSQAEDRTPMTTADGALGTPAYMAPEQIQARDAEAAVGPRADVYALAATFYELWTGRRLFDHGRDRAGATTRKLAGERPERPRAFAPGLAKEVEAILLGGLEAVPADRYPSATALAEDCERALRDEPIRFRPPGKLRRARLAYRRNRTAASLTILFVLTFAAGVGRYVQDVRREQERADQRANDAMTERTRADERTAEAERAALRAEVSAHELSLGVLWSRLERRDGDYSRVAVAVTNGAASLTAGVDASRQRALSRASGVDGDSGARLDSVRRSCLTVAETAVTDAANVLGRAIAGTFRPTCARWSPDGRRILAGSTVGHLAIWDVATGLPVVLLEGHSGRVNECAFSPDGRRALSSSGDGTMRLWDAETGKFIRVFRGHTSEVFGCAFSPDGERALSGGGDYTLRLWDVDTGAMLRVLPGHTKMVAACAVSPDGRRALSASFDGTLRLWDLESGQTVRVLEGHSKSVCTCAFSPDGERALSGSFDETLRLWDLENGEALHVFKESSLVNGCAFSSDGHRALSSSWDGALRLWDVEERKLLPITTFAGYTGMAGCAFSPDGRSALSVSGDGPTMRLWSLETGQALRALDHADHTDHVTSCVFSPDGRRALSASQDKSLRLWDVETGQTIRVLRGHEGGVTTCVLSSDGRRALSASHDRTLRMWDVETGRTTRVLKGHHGAVTTCLLSSDGRRALSASQDSTLRLWDVETGQTIRVFEGHGESVTSCALSVDGRRALSASGDGLRLWDVETGQTIRVFEGHGESVTSCALSVDGRRALSASLDMTLRVWDVETGDTLHVLEGHRAPVTACALSPDGRVALSASDDSMLLLWDVESGKNFHYLGGHTQRVSACALSPDGRRALSASDDGTLRVWTLDIDQPLHVLEGHAGEVSSCRFSLDGRRLLSASHDGTLRAWDARTGQTLRVLEGHARGVWSCALSPDGSRALSASDDGTLRLWDVDSGQTLRVLRGHEGGVNACAFAPDGSRALSASDDTTLRLWDLDTGTTVRGFLGHTGWVSGCALSPDGRRALSTSGDHTLRLWDVETGLTLVDLMAHTQHFVSAGATACAFSPDGRRALASSTDGKLYLWTVETGQSFRVLEGHTGKVRACAFSPEGRRVVSAASDDTLIVWDAETGNILRTLQGHEDDVTACAFSPDGRFVISGSKDRTVRQWDLGSAPDVFIGDRGSVAPAAVEARLALGRADALRPVELPALVSVGADAVAPPLDLSTPDRLAALGLDELLARATDPDGPPAPGATSGRNSLRAAAEQGYAPAMTRLAWALERGLGGPIDAAALGEAAALRSEAVARGDPLACGDVDAAASSGDPLACTLQAVARADLRALRELAKRGEPDAILALAERLPAAEAVSLLERGAEACDPRCVRRLGELLLASDPIRAWTLLRRARGMGQVAAAESLVVEAARRGDDAQARAILDAEPEPEAFVRRAEVWVERAVRLLPEAERNATVRRAILVVEEKLPPRTDRSKNEPGPLDAVAERWFPRDAELLRGRGWARRQAGDPRGAIELLDASIGLVESSADAWNSRAIARSDLDDGLGALEDYDRAVLLDPRNALVRSNRAFAREAVSDYVGAIDDWTQAAAIDSRSEYVLGRGRSELLALDLARAIEDLSLLTTTTGEPRAQRRLGLALAFSGDRQRAIEHLTQGVENETDVSARYYGALWLAGLGAGSRWLELHADGADWPAPLVRAALGRATEEEAMAAADAAPNDAQRRARRREVFGILGLFAERDNDLASARRRYEACVALEPPPEVESAWARLRLRQMAAGGHQPPAPEGR